MYLLASNKNLFLNKITKLNAELKLFEPVNILQSLELFENQLTLTELTNCLMSSEPNTFDVLIRFFAVRWVRIRSSSMCYTQKPAQPVNVLCLELAKAVFPPDETYLRLMPSLEIMTDVYGDNIHSLGLHEFILSDNERTFIPVAQCLQLSYQSDSGQFRHLTVCDNLPPYLTSAEVERLCNHSQHATALYQAIIALNKQRLLGDDFGSKISQLALALKGGGVHGAGAEYDAGSAANVGIAAFSGYWESLSQQQQVSIVSEFPGLKNILGRLFRPSHADYQAERFCVELLAEALAPIILAYNNTPNIQQLLQVVADKQAEFEDKNNPFSVNTHNMNSPKHILRLIFELDMETQQSVFATTDCEDALMYALAYEPEALLDFDLNAELQQKAISVRLNSHHDTALIVAAKHGKENVIALLLLWDKDLTQLELYDSNNSTALHWAANNGHINTVKRLITSGACLEARGAGNNTALTFAALRGRGDVVTLLLQNNANVNARNNQGMNALEIVIKMHPEFIATILMHVTTLPLDAQAECLRQLGAYPNVLFYAAAHKPSLFERLVRQLESCDQAHFHIMLKTLDQKGFSPLILAAQIGDHETTRKILALNLVDIESRGSESTALHWAANNGHADVVECLLMSGASINARGFNGNTALTFAVFHGKSAVVDFLLRNNADLTVRQSGGKNAIDIAIEKHPELIEMILMHMVSLPVNEQANCLLNVAEGLYDNIFTYAAIEKPSLLNQLFASYLSKQTHKDVSIIVAILSGIHFDEHLQSVNNHYQRIKKRYQCNLNRIAATSAAKMLIIECVRAKIMIFQQEVSIEDRLFTFKATCMRAITKAEPALRKYSLLGKSFVAGSLPVTFPLYAIGLFSIKSKYECSLHHFKKELDKPCEPVKSVYNLHI